MARLTATDRNRNEAAVRAAMERLLGGDLPPGGKCDLKTIASLAGITRTGFYPKKNRDGTIRPAPTSIWPRSSNADAPSSKKSARSLTRTTHRSSGSRQRTPP